MTYFLITFPLFISIYFLILYGIKKGFMLNNKKSRRKTEIRYKWTHHALIGLAGSIPVVNGVWLVGWFLGHLLIQYDDLHQHVTFKHGKGPLRLLLGKHLKILFPLWLLETFLDKYLQNRGASPLHEVSKLWREKLYYYLEAKGGIWNKIAQLLKF